MVGVDGFLQRSDLLRLSREHVISHIFSFLSPQACGQLFSCLCVVITRTNGCTF